MIDAGRVKRLCSPELISKNDDGAFWQIDTLWLAVGGRTTIRANIPGKFEYEGWYRFQSDDYMGEKVEGDIFWGAVSCDDEARLNVLYTALDHALLKPEEGILPIRLHLLSARESFLQHISSILKDDGNTCFIINEQVREFLRTMHSVYLCFVPEYFVCEFYREPWEAPTRVWVNTNCKLPYLLHRPS